MPTEPGIIVNPFLFPFSGAEGSTGGNVITDGTTARTLSIGDSGAFIRMTSGDVNTITVPANVDVKIPVKTEITVIQLGAGQTGFIAAPGVTINAEAFCISAQYRAATLKKVAENEWDLYGPLLGVPVPPFVYRLNGDAAVAAALGMSGVLAMVAPDYLQGSHLIGSSNHAFAGIPESFVDTFPVVAGVMVFELEFISAPWSAGMESSYVAGGGLAVINGEDTPLDFMELSLGIDATETKLRCGANIDVATLAENYADGKRLGVYVNTVSGAIGVKTADTDYPAATSYNPAGVVKLMPGLVLGGPNQVLNISGETVTLKLHVRRDDFTMTYPAGAVDCYGVEI